MTQLHYIPLSSHYWIWLLDVISIQRARMGPVVFCKLKSHDQDQAPAPSNCYKIINNLGQPPKPKSTPILYSISDSFHYIHFFYSSAFIFSFYQKIPQLPHSLLKKKKKKTQLIVLFRFYYIFRRIRVEVAKLSCLYFYLFIFYDYSLFFKSRY